MTSTTAKGYPYPNGNDPVRNGENAMEALARAVDKRQSVAGTTAAAALNAAASATVAVTFPVGSFTVAPIVVASATTARVTCGPGLATASGFSCGVGNWSPANAGAYSLQWAAVSQEVI